MKILSTLRYWAGGIRLYIGIGIAVVTLEVIWWAHTVFPDASLATIRMQEVYAWLSVFLLSVTLLIGPVTKAFARLPWKPQIRDARRLIGIGAAWFALLHMVITYFGQLKGGNPFDLPLLYQKSLLLGVIAMICLLALAFTSVNAIMKAWGVWWFRLHRLVYVAALAALMHAFIIGAHATGTVALVAIAGVSAIWIGFNLYLLKQNPQASKWKLFALSYGVLMLLAVLNYGLSQHQIHNGVIIDHSRHQH
jgi:DMSO/TMAO reductase YedYZ heme-binding membrane subunit